MKSLLSLVALAFSLCALAQPSSEKEILDSYQNRRKMSEVSLLKNYPVRNIGPTVQGGRIVDIDVNLKNTKEFYVAFASGGIFKTTNNGITFDPVFDNNDALGIGDFALSQTNPSILYVGTGEKNSSRSSYAGSGIYKTVDGGKTWTHLGLTTTQHISRVVIHPQNDDIVWVAAIGSLYSLNPERGLFKTADGGKTWKKTLFINDSTGVIDVIVNPKNPNQLFASTWQRSRTAWNFTGNGRHSTVYKSEDGGETWTKSASGLPAGESVGRIGLEISPSNPNILYAIIDSQREVEDKTKKKGQDKLRIENFHSMSKDEFLKLDDKKLDGFLKDSGFPKQYTAERVKRDVREVKYTPKVIAEYFGGDANASLFNTKIVGAELYRSDNGGTSWKRMHSYDLDGVYHTFGYYFGELKVAGDNPDMVYVFGVPLLKSRDGGVTWHRIDTLKGVRAVHVDHHALWINPNDSRHLLLGNDGGLYQSYDEGANWLHINNMPVGQFYTVNVDMETPYNVYGGLQDNGVLRGSSKSIPNETKHWWHIFSGDGMFVAADPRNHKVIYGGYQFGNYTKAEFEKNKWTKITPKHNIGEQPPRWNWRSPLILSKHNPDIVYMAANKVYRSLNQAESWEVISDDLTTQRKDQGNVPFSTISSLAESPLKFGLLYVGTDDGNVWVTKDGGGKWELINAGLPANKWVSSVTPSPHDEATVFVSVNGYREDDFRTYVFVSNDFGKTWKSVKGNLPESVANIIIQDPVNPNLIYCGLDNGTYASFDGGNTWHLFNGMLNVPSYDMIVHPRENELVVATHGRSVFIADVKPLQSVKRDAINTGVIAFAPSAVNHNENWGEKRYPWDKVSQPKIEILYYVGKEASSITIEVFDEKNNLVRKLTAPARLGFNTFTWDAKVITVPESKNKSKNKVQAENQFTYAGKGKYKIKFHNSPAVSEIPLEIK